MKKVIFSMAIATMIAVNGYSQEAKNSTSEKVEQSTESNASFGVRGNCGMCKSTIEKAASSIDGVTDAIWDKENKKIDVSYDGSKTNLTEIHSAIAASGYDTDMSKADDKAYENLAGCCQYDREMKMSISAKKKDHEH